MTLTLLDHWKRIPTPVQQVLRRQLALYQPAPNINDLTQIFNIKELIIPYETYSFINFDLLRPFNKLQTLSITNSNGFPDVDLVDLSGLSHLKDLKQLILKNFSFKSLNGLEQLNGLTHLDIGSCKIEDPQAIGALDSLKYLIYDNDYSDHKGNNIFDVGFMASLRSLELLKIHTQGQISFAPLSALSNLKYLDLSFYNNYYNQNNYEALSQLTSLLQLDLSYSWIKETEFLRPLTKLTHLNLGTNQLSDCTPLAALTELIYLDLYGYYGQTSDKLIKLKDISPLQNCTKLSYLHINHHEIEDISSLNSLTSLHELHIDHNLLKDISALAQCKALQRLNISDNAITDLVPLAELDNLIELSLMNTQVKDLTPLLNLSNLKEIHIGGTSISTRKLNLFRKTRPDCVIYN